MTASSVAGWFTFTPHQITLLMCAYGFTASVLPVWLLLEPRDYLSTYMRLGTIAILILGVFLVRPDIEFPMVTEFVHGGGPIIPGKLYPFLFVTIACGAISGFHSLISSGTTPKMLNQETDARMIGYGAGDAAELHVPSHERVAALANKTGKLKRKSVPRLAGRGTRTIGYSPPRVLLVP
jgi:carbon starvation protein